MSTRGLYGFIINEEEYLIFSPFDSYPSGLGKMFFDFCKRTNLSELKKKLEDLPSIVISDNEAEMKYQISELGYSMESLNYLYQKHENVFELINHGLIPIFLNDKEFKKDTLFCEWVYYYNFDKHKFFTISQSKGKTYLNDLDDKYEESEYED